MAENDKCPDCGSDRYLYEPHGKRRCKICGFVEPGKTWMDVAAEKDEIAADLRRQLAAANQRVESLVLELERSKMVMPENVNLYNACTERCDVANGPCACGAWHNAQETMQRLADELAAAKAESDEASRIVASNAGLTDHAIACLAEGLLGLTIREEQITPRVRLAAAKAYGRHQMPDKLDAAKQRADDAEAELKKLRESANQNFAAKARELQAENERLRNACRLSLDAFCSIRAVRDYNKALGVDEAMSALRAIPQETTDV